MFVEGQRVMRVVKSITKREIKREPEVISRITRAGFIYLRRTAKREKFTLKGYEHLTREMRSCSLYIITIEPIPET